MGGGRGDRGGHRDTKNVGWMLTVVHSRGESRSKSRVLYLW